MQLARPLFRLFLATAALPLLGGCVSRAELDAAKQQLDTCERDKVAAQKAQGDCEGRLTTEAKRWDAIESQLTSSLPQTLKSFEEERSRIIQIVPEQVRKEVGQRLDRYFVNVSKQFDRMEGRLEALREELKTSREELVEIRRTTTSVDTKVEATHKAVLVEQERSGDRQRRVAEVIAAIVEFDRSRVNCEKCKERIKVKGEHREQLLAFHSELIEKVQALQADGTTH